MKTMPKWATRTLAAVILIATYFDQHMQLIPPGLRVFHVSVAGLAHAAAVAFAALGLSGPALWPGLASLLGNPPAATPKATQ